MLLGPGYKKTGARPVFLNVASQFYPTTNGRFPLTGVACPLGP